MNTTELQNQIKQIAREMMPSFSSDDSLLDQFDSLQIIALVGQVEKVLAVQLPAVELSRENLKSTETLAALVSRYRIGK